MSILSDISNAIEELDYDEDMPSDTGGEATEAQELDDGEVEEKQEEEEGDECVKEGDDDDAQPPSSSSDEEEKEENTKTTISPSRHKKKVRKQVLFAKPPQDSVVHACMQLHVKVAQCASFDSEDAREIVVSRMALERVNIKKELQTTNDAIRMLSTILDEREAVLKTAVDENLLDTESPLFTFFVKKQARLLDMLNALKQKKDVNE